MKPTPILAFLALGLSLLFTGCLSNGKLDSISATLADLKPIDSSLLETRVTMTVRYTSESLNPFGFSGASHKLYLNGGYIGRAVSHTPVGLPPLTSTTQDVTLLIENAALIKQVLAMQGQLVAHYRLDSILFTTGPDGEVKLTTSSEGTIDLRDLQSAH